MIGTLMIQPNENYYYFFVAVYHKKTITEELELFVLFNIIEQNFTICPAY